MSFGRMRVVVTAAVVALLLYALPVLAYDETNTGRTCEQCHGVASPTTIKGPHGAYATTTKKCQTCHTVHAAPAGGIQLLPSATIKGVCLTCHDGSGGRGVYGTILMRGITPGAQHRIDVTNVVPGGNASTGGSATYTFEGVSNRLTCSDCHSPHDSNTVNTFTGDRSRSDTSTISYVSNRLLKQRPNGSAYAITEYGSDWCGACHKGRLTYGSGVNNHPVETTATAGYFRYNNVAYPSNTTGTMGRTNLGYVMPFPRTAAQGTHKPICQQCHEDSRNVGDVTQGQIAGSEVFTVTTADGTTASNNPRFQNSPHEAVNAYMLVEIGDDLCTNCHSAAAQLP